MRLSLVEQRTSTRTDILHTPPPHNPKPTNSSLGSLHLLLDEQEIVAHEAKSAMYRTSAYFCAKQVCVFVTLSALAASMFEIDVRAAAVEVKPGRAPRMSVHFVYMRVCLSFIYVLSLAWYTCLVVAAPVWCAAAVDRIV